MHNLFLNTHTFKKSQCNNLDVMLKIPSLHIMLMRVLCCSDPKHEWGPSKMEEATSTSWKHMQISVRLLNQPLQNCRQQCFQDVHNGQLIRFYHKNGAAGCNTII